MTTPRDACPKCGRTLAEHSLDPVSQWPLMIVTCPTITCPYCGEVDNDWQARAPHSDACLKTMKEDVT